MIGRGRGGWDGTDHQEAAAPWRLLQLRVRGEVDEGWGMVVQLVLQGWGSVVSDYDTAVLRGAALVDSYRELRGPSSGDRQQQVAEMVADLVAWLYVKD